MSCGLLVEAGGVHHLQQLVLALAGVVEAPGVAPQHDPHAQQQARHHREHDGDQQVHKEGEKGPADKDEDHEDDDEEVGDDPGDEEVAADNHGGEDEEEGGEEVEGGEDDEGGQDELG